MLQSKWQTKINNNDKSKNECYTYSTYCIKCGSRLSELLAFNLIDKHPILVLKIIVRHDVYEFIYIYYLFYTKVLFDHPYSKICICIVDWKQMSIGLLYTLMCFQFINQYDGLINTTVFQC